MSKCKHDDCVYAMQDDCGTSRKHCGYILITNEPRGCKVENCTKYVSKERTANEKQGQAEKRAQAQRYREKAKTVL